MHEKRNWMPHVPRSVGWLFMLLMAWLGTPACDRSPDAAQLTGTNASLPPTSPGYTSDRGYIAIIAAGRNDPWWPIIQVGARRYHDALGGKDLRFFLPEGDEVQDQIKVLETLERKDLHGICIHPASTDAILSSLEPIHMSGVPVVTMLTALDVDWNLSHVGLDDREIGVQLARLTARALDHQGTVMLLHAGFEDRVYGPRRRHLLEEWRRYPKIELFAQIDCHANPREARAIMRERSARFPRLSAWVSVGDWPLRDWDGSPPLLPAPMQFITFGGTPAQMDLVEAGTSPGFVAAEYGDVGDRAVRLCHVALMAEDQYRPTNETLPLRTVTMRNVDDYRRDWAAWCVSSVPEDARVDRGPAPSE